MKKQPALRFEREMPLAKIKPHPENPRAHSPEQTNRCAFIVELDPQHVDTIVRRWQDFTGQEATHDGSGDTYNARAKRPGKAKA